MEISPLDLIRKMPPGSAVWGSERFNHKETGAAKMVWREASRGGRIGRSGQSSYGFSDYSTLENYALPVE
jgi:hypothetical protein